MNIIRNTRLKKRITQKQLADLIGVSQAYISKIESNEFVKVMTNVRDAAKSVTPLYKSANFDECEIFDLFGVNFVGNTNLHRLYMPDSWKGHPMLKSYVQDDERLAWND